MKNAKILFLIPFLVSGIAVGAKYNFAEADSLYAQREKGLADVAKARLAYETGLAEAKDTADKIYAVEMLGKLAYFEGDLLLKDDDSTAGRREELFNQCLDYVKNIAPDEIGKETGAYYFWNTTCLALWGKAVGAFRAIWYVGDMASNLEKGLALDAIYDRGALHRLAASIYTRSKMLAALGLYNPDLALEHIQKSIDISDEYYNIYGLKALILIEKDRKAEAKALLEAKSKELKERLDNGNLPKGLEAESKIYLLQLNGLLSTLG